MIWLVFIIAMLLPSWAEAACTGASPTWTCTSDQATLKAFFETSPVAIVEGDTINLSPCATSEWNQQVMSGEKHAGGFLAVPGYTLNGGGESCTIIKRGPTYSESGDPFHGLFVLEVLATSGVTRITGITFDGDSKSTPSQGLIAIVGTGLDKVHIDHVTVTNVSGKGIAAYGNRSSSGNLQFTGLIDHATCNATGPTNVDCFYFEGSWFGSNQNGFLVAPALGTNQSWYVEDSTCNYAIAGDVCIDATKGASVVFRYNTSNRLPGFHGADSGKRGARQIELFRNTFIAPYGVNQNTVNYRTGPSVMFDNAYTNGTFNYTNGLSFTLQRTVGTYSALGTGKCDGLNVYGIWDGNLGTGTPDVDGKAPVGNPGWPCLDQTGWFFTGVGPNGANAIYTPAYLWRNSVAGANMAYTTNDLPVYPCTVPGCGAYSLTYEVADRDYYKGGIVAQTSASSPFDGTTGVGVGTLARRPATCTTGTLTTNGGVGGVGYWATDQGSWNTSTTDATFNPSGVAGEDGILYKCTATNTWTAYYTPYAYPHPLQGSAPSIPAAPTGLAKIGTSTGTTCTVSWPENNLANLVGYHLKYGTSTGVYTTTITKTAALSAAAHQPPRQHTFLFPIAATYYITVTAFSASVSDTANATEVTCVSTGLSRTAASLFRGGH